MTPGNIALLIIAVAVLLLVLFIGLFLVRLTRTLGVITRDVDIIAREADEILANANILLTDVNDKMATIDPVVQAAADLGTSVSELNDATHHLTSRVKGTASNKNVANVASAFGVVNNLRKHRKNSVTK